MKSENMASTKKVTHILFPYNLYSTHSGLISHMLAWGIKTRGKSLVRCQNFFFPTLLISLLKFFVPDRRPSCCHHEAAVVHRHGSRPPESDYCFG